MTGEGYIPKEKAPRTPINKGWGERSGGRGKAQVIRRESKRRVAEGRGGVEGLRIVGGTEEGSGPPQAADSTSHVVGVGAGAHTGSRDPWTSLAAAGETPVATAVAMRSRWRWSNRECTGSEGGRETDGKSGGV